MPSLADAALVPQAGGNVDCTSSDLTSEHHVPAIQAVCDSQTAQSVAHGNSYIWEWYRNRGFPEDVVNIMCASWRKGSVEQYSVYFRKWLHFCSTRETDPLQLDEVEVLTFLTEMYKKGESYSAINTARSALSVILSKNGLSIGNFISVKRFMKGIFELRPPMPRYTYIWDVNIIFEFLMNFSSEDIPLSYLTYKLVTLLALATAQRAQTLHLIDLENFVYNNNEIIVPIPQLLKQSNPRNRKFSLRLSCNVENPSICVVTTLKEYIRRTKNIRGNQRQLFISFNKPHRAVSRSTISRWIKTVLREAGIDVSIFKAHSTRAASCSHAKRNAVPIEHILKTAGWANDKTFRKFYDKVVEN